MTALLALAWVFWAYRMGVVDHDDMLSNELIFAREPLGTLLLRIPWPDQSALYFLFLKVLRLAGDTPFAIQFANAALLSVSLVTTWVLALALTDSRKVAAVAMLLGAISPAGLWLVRFGRMYSLQVFFSMVAALFVVRHLHARRRRDLIAFAIVSLLSIYTHFFGFLITALLFLPLLFEGAIVAVTGAGILVMSVPQLVRLTHLAGAGTPMRADASLPALSLRFLDRVSWFWFVNSDWGALGTSGRSMAVMYLGSIVALACLGLVSMRRRLGVHAAMWILLPLAAVGSLAAWMDIRDRYFIWALPLLWISIAAGGVGELPMPSSSSDAARDIARGVRGALVLLVAVGSSWLLWQKLPERRPEGTKLLTAVARLYRPSMKVYMPPSSALGIPRLIALQQRMPAGLADVRSLSQETRSQFLQEVDAGSEFVFLLLMTPPNEEMRWRSRYLEEHGYRKAVIPVFAAGAQIFTHGPLEGWSHEQRLEANPPASAIARWADDALRRGGEAHRQPELANALVARIDTDGVAHVAALFTSQRGEWGSWRLGPAEADGVEDARMTSGGTERTVVAARPVASSTLLIAHPAVRMKKTLELTCGLADGAVAKQAAVEIAMFVNGAYASDLSCGESAGWNRTAIDTSAEAGRAAGVELLITSHGDVASRLGYQLNASSAEVPSEMVARRGPIVLTGGRRLSDDVGGLRVYRLAGNRQISARVDGRTYSAEDMHEAPGPNGEGTVHRVWALGAAPWDAVGSTRQRSNGEPRKGIWAHPRTGTTLVIEAPAAQMQSLLHAYAGFTDYSLHQAHGLHLEAPVTFRLAVDGRSVLTHDAARTPGWSDLVVPTGAPPGPHRLRIEISAPIDSWAHFVFDLWND